MISTQYLAELKAQTDGKKFSFAGLEGFARVVRAYDGDTCTLLFKPDWSANWIKETCRMNGYNSAEIKGSSEDEKRIAIFSRDHLRELILDKNVYVVFGQMDKYGRPLIDIYLDAEKKHSVNQLMLTGGYGAVYHGRGEKKYQ